MVPPDSDRAPPTPPYSGFRLGWRAFRVRGCHPLRPAFPGAFRYARFFLCAGPTTPRAPRRPRFGLSPFRSPLLGGSPPPRGLSRPAASFFASGSQGILRTPSLASRSREFGDAPAPPSLAFLSFRFLFVSAFLPILSKNRAGHLRGPPWWRMWGSNPRPPACKAGALAN